MINPMHIIAGVFTLSALVSCGGGTPSGSTPAPSAGGSIKAEVTSVKEVPSTTSSTKLAFEFTFKNTGTKTLAQTSAKVAFTLGTKQVGDDIAVLNAPLAPGETKSVDSVSVPAPSAYTCYTYSVTAIPDDYSGTYQFTSTPQCH
ncbi:CARDB domain-containing protein [Deinococcus sonorensis]|uniref:CARDB domain-containing protein n=2 Tax=Deinococcus sonorensis TaxID=309891 RepID=A0AAU7U7J6_9DEIO